jgi:glucokinase
MLKESCLTMAGLPVSATTFTQHFKRKGRFADLMERIPVHVIVAPAGLAGAAAYGLEKTIPELAFS